MRARRARLVALLLLGLIVAGDLILEAMLDFRQLQRLRTEGTRQNAIAREAASLIAVVQNYESAQRGYLLTDRDEYAVSHPEAMAEVRRHLDELRRLQNEDAEGIARVDLCGSLAETKLLEAGESVRLAQIGRKDAALELVRGGAGREMMLRLRESVEDLARPARADLAAIREDLNRVIDRTLRLTMAKAVLLALMVVAMFAFAMNEIRALERPTTRAPSEG